MRGPLGELFVANERRLVVKQQNIG